jgi:hypothetical protein
LFEPQGSSPSPQQQHKMVAFEPVVQLIDDFQIVCGDGDPYALGGSWLLPARIE